MPDYQFNTLLDNAFSSFSANTAIRFYRSGTLETKLTYGGLDAQVNLFSARLLPYCVKKGDRVILLMEKSLIWVVAYLSLLRMGVVLVPLNPGFTKRELAYLINDAAPCLVISDAAKTGVIQRISPGLPVLEMDGNRPFEEQKGGKTGRIPAKAVFIQADDPLLMIYTSGTTGNPKGAVLTSENLCCDAANIISVWEICQQDVLCHALPLFHIHGLCFALHTALISGACVILMDKFSPDTVLERLSSKADGQKVSIFMAVPTMYSQLVGRIGNRNIDFSHLRLLTSGSAPLLESTFKDITHTFGKEPVEREGMSETGMNFSNPLHGRKIPGSIGLPLPNISVRVVDPDTGRDLDRGCVGEFWLKSRSITKGYWKKPDRTSEAFDNGWFKTGDLGYADKNGYYYLTDRIKHIIITGGENVSAKEVETVINRFSGVKESAVVGIPDSKWGETVSALVVLDNGARVSREHLIAHCRAHLHPYKVPKKLFFTSSIPKNTMGKVLKKEVKRTILSLDRL